MVPTNVSGRQPVDPARAREVFEELVSSPWTFHGWAPEVHVSWALGQEALELLYELVEDGARTLETGAGLSTVVFALRGARHTVVSPWAHEHDRIRTWCLERAVPLDRLTFVARPSQDALPELGDEPLDVVLIDGDHAFPAPFLDWYYACLRLRPGGLLIVDDTHLKTGEILRAFLLVETERWRVHTDLATTTVFQRLDGPLIPDVGWEGQPFCAPDDRRPGRAGSAWRWLRRRVRLRTRLRRLGRFRRRGAGTS